MASTSRAQNNSLWAKTVKLFKNDYLRRQDWWVNRRLTWRRLWNILGVVGAYLGQRRRVPGTPPILKIDISPLCNLHCTVCLHAHREVHPELACQRFRSDQFMSLAEYTRIIEEVAATTSAVSLYYFGDPYVHPEVDAMCRIARDKGLSVHLCSNFSFHFSDERIAAIARSGVTHLTICVDGFEQETYQLTRNGGRLDWVLSNLERLCAYKQTHHLTEPQIEVQYIKYPHNVDQLASAREYFARIGVDRVETFWGALFNTLDLEQENYQLLGVKSRSWLPRCYWPYVSMVIKYQGGVVPCCNYRAGKQYIDQEDPKLLGNVFQDGGVRAVWNNNRYQRMRQVVCNPGLFQRDPGSESCYCYGCREVFETDIERNLKRAPAYRFEQLYEYDSQRRRSVRLDSPGPLPGAGEPEEHPG